MNLSELRFIRQAGFSLLEVLVAFAILSLSLGIILHSYSSSLQGISLTEKYSKAVELAETQLSQVGITYPLAPGETQGSWNESYVWRLTISQDETIASEVSQFQPVLVDVEVSWQEGERRRSVNLSTMKLLRRSQL